MGDTVTGEGDVTWHPLGASADVAAGQVRLSTIEVDGETRHLAMWRTEGGRPCVAEDRCPHQWSSLAAEGFVDGEQLVCSAHGWRFDPDGSGWKRSMTGRDDPKAPLATYACREVDGQLWVGPAEE